MEECFEAKINAAVFLELNALVWEQTYNFEFPDITLYPKNKSKNMFSVSNNDLEFIEPINKSINTFSMNHSSVFSENMPVYCLPQIIDLEMSSDIDLFYAHFNGTEINKSFKITDDNSKYECFHKIISNGEDFSVVWAENSENDPFMFNGLNSIHRKQFNE